MLILGLGGLGYKDASAAVVRDGRIVAAVAEERLTRTKHQGGYPALAIDACLRMAGAGLADVDHVAVANNPWLALREKILAWYGHGFFESPEFRAYHIFHDEIHATLRYLKSLEDLRAGRGGRFHVVRHHLAHLASSFLASPHEHAALLDMDGRGELSTSAQGEGRGAGIEVFRVDHMPNSLGLLHGAVSDYLGFTGQGDEFRVMSISTQGEPTHLDRFQQVVRLAADGAYELDRSYFTYREGMAALSDRFTQVFGPRRLPGEPVLQRHRDLAASLQRAIEGAVLHAARHLRERTRADALCFAGGVAFNWLANGRIAAEGPFRHVYVNSMAGDDGTAVGAALHVWAEQTGARPEPLGTAALGPAIEESAAEDVLRSVRARFERVADPAAAAAARIAAGEIVGWVQGRAEFGPRCLGKRAILADPSRADVKARLLREVKPREDHHTFALSLAEEAAGQVFASGRPSPWMLLWDTVRPERRAELACVVSPAGTARWHSVTSQREPAFHQLLAAFSARTGRLPALLNTSLNLPGRPPALDTRDALQVFATTGVDALFVGPYVVTK
ncbi:MAG: Decarbamoylnovobiocin carbamoyltransferase [Planctomycetes bacterium]|nr:Decarbamoylnovobiocin carbamoyltransferase [Planctomycetota bacterium]